MTKVQIKGVDKAAEAIIQKELEDVGNVGELDARMETFAKAAGLAVDRVVEDGLPTYRFRHKSEPPPGEQGLGIVLPDGYRPMTFAALIDRYAPTLPTIGADLALRAKVDCATHDLSEGIAIIHALEELELVQFAEAPNGEPSIFSAPEWLFYKQLGERPLEEINEMVDAVGRLVAFFDQTGEVNYATGERHVKTEKGVGEWATYADWAEAYPLAVRGIAEQARCSRRVVEETLRMWEDEKTVRFVKLPDGKVWGMVGTDEFERHQPSRTERAVFNAFAEKFQLEPVRDVQGMSIFTDARRPKPRRTMKSTSYMRAVEAQFGALALLEEMSRKRRGPGRQTELGGMSIASMYLPDLEAFKAADTYCWFPEPLHATDVAAATIQPDAQISRDMTEGYAGWWYFMEPYPLQTTSMEEPLVALLWTWMLDEREFGALRVSAYIEAERFNYTPIPTTLFTWREGETLQAMLDRARQEYAIAYAHTLGKPENRDLYVGVEDTMHAVERLAKLWAAGVTWMQDKILVFGEGKVHRAERRRLTKRHKDKVLNTVQIVELRRKVTVSEEQPDGTKHTIEYSCRWVVRGHFRMQWYPSLGRHKLKFIKAYPKGPADKPLKVSTHTIYKVDR